MNLYQQGNQHVLREFYDKIIKALPPRKLKSLNLGSGIAFEFEKRFRELRPNYGDEIDCVDIISLDYIPDFINNYFCKSLETDLSLNEKYDIIFCFEVIEHIDNTDSIIKNAYKYLKPEGKFYISHPNLSSLYSRFELLLGFQPHILEPSNNFPNAGGGIFARKNNPENIAIHHIRGITYNAMNELLKIYHFSIKKLIGQDNFLSFLSYFPKFSSVICYECLKDEKIIQLDKK